MSWWDANNDAKIDDDDDESSFGIAEPADHSKRKKKRYNFDSHDSSNQSPIHVLFLTMNLVTSLLIPSGFCSIISFVASDTQILLCHRGGKVRSCPSLMEEAGGSSTSCLELNALFYIQRLWSLFRYWDMISIMLLWTIIYWSSCHCFSFLLL